MGPPGFQQQRQNFPSQQQQSAPQEKKPSMEEMMMQYMAKLDSKVKQVMQSNQSSIHNLEVQVEQLAKMVADRGQGKFPSNIEVNPKEGAMAITLRSGKNVENPRKAPSEEQSP